MTLVSLLLLGSFGCNITSNNNVLVVSPNVQTKITYLEEPQKGTVTYKRLPLKIYGGKVSSFTLSYDNPKRIYVALAGGEIYKTEDLGKTWEKIAKIVAPSNNPSFSINSIRENDDGRVLYVLTSDGIFKSEDSGKTFMQIGDTLPPDFNPDSIIVSKDDPELIIVSSGNANLRSSDGGKTFISVATGLFYIDYNYVTNELFATDTHRLFMSKDFGLKWEKLETTFDYIESFSISQSNPTKIVVKAQNDTYLSKDSGKHFEKLTVPFRVSSKFCINPKDTNFIVAFPMYVNTFLNAKMFVSKDGGASFNDFPIFNVISDAKFSLDGSKVFILTYEGVLYSWDSKSTYRVENVFPEVYFKDIGVYNDKSIICTNGASFKVDFSNGSVTALNKDGLDYLVHVAISEKDPTVVYASSSARLFVLEGINLKTIRDIEFVEQLVIDPLGLNKLFIITGSEDGGLDLCFLR